MDSRSDVMKAATSARLFDDGWTCGMILKGSKTDHYRCPLCFPLFREGHPRSHNFPGTLREGSRLLGSGLVLITVASVFVL